MFSPKPSSAVANVPTGQLSAPPVPVVPAPPLVPAVEPPTPVVPPRPAVALVPAVPVPPRPALPVVPVPPRPPAPVVPPAAGPPPPSPQPFNDSPAAAATTATSTNQFTARFFMSLLLLYLPGQTPQDRAALPPRDTNTTRANASKKTGDLR